MSSMDSLAANGIINFDPDAYVMNGVSRAMAEEDSSLPFEKPLYANPYVPYRVAYIKPEQPPRDVYVRHEKEQGISWKSILLGLLAGGGITYAGFKVLENNDEKIKTKLTGTAVKKDNKTLWTKCKDSIKQTKDDFVGWIKKKRNGGEIEKAVNEAAKNPAKEQKGFFKKYYKTKVALCVAAGLGVLYAIYKGITSRSHHGEE